MKNNTTSISKIWLILLGTVLTFSSSAIPFTNGKQYIILDKTIVSEPQQPQVLEFFSFYCPPCYQLEQILHTSNNIKSKLPKNIKMIKYHVESLGLLGKELTQAWAIAVTLGIEDKITPLIFEAVQKKLVLQTFADIREIFVNAGVSSKYFDAAWNSFTIKLLVAKQKKAVLDLQPHYLPAVYVNGKYQINIRNIDTTSVEAFVQQYTDIIRYLVEKK